jgi:hypothetical protein
MKDGSPVPGKISRLGASLEVCSWFGVGVVRSVANAPDAEHMPRAHATAAILSIVDSPFD